jgi:DNA-dependent metalloprotease WSS1
MLRSIVSHFRTTSVFVTMPHCSRHPMHQQGNVASTLDRRVHLTATLGWRDDARAKTYMEELKQRANRVLAIRGWRVLELKEFFPRDKRLLGLNVNRGQEVCIRFREPANRDVFFPLEAIVATLLHELVHCKVGPHNNIFWALYKELSDEEEDRDLRMALVVGTNRLRTFAADREPLPLAATDASRSGVRLGGVAPRGNASLVMRDLVAAAALKRREMEVLENGVSKLSFEGCSQTFCNEGRRPREETTIVTNDPKEAMVSAYDEEGRELASSGVWQCPRCFFHNHLLMFPVCEMCSEAPLTVEDATETEGSGRRSNPIVL